MNLSSKNPTIFRNFEFFWTETEYAGMIIIDD